MPEVRNAAKAALPRTCCLWLTPGQAIYAGPSLDPGLHAGSVACLAIGIDGPFRLRTERATYSARSALIPPRLQHEVIAPDTRMIFCYLDAGSSRERGCRERMSCTAEVLHGHCSEDELTTWPTPGWLDAAAPAERVRMDPRISTATAALRSRPSCSAAELARRAMVSPSRFLHLFRQETGTSLRRYRLWCRMLNVAATLRDGHDLTRAAADAGFASASHFSTAFRRMFGLPPSALLRSGVTIRFVHDQCTSGIGTA